MGWNRQGKITAGLSGVYNFQRKQKGSNGSSTYILRICCKTPSGCLKLEIVINSMYTLFSPYVHSYDKV